MVVPRLVPRLARGRLLEARDDDLRFFHYRDRDGYEVDVVLVRDARYPSRSRAIEIAVAEHLVHLRRRRLDDACAQLDPDEEAALAEAALGADAGSLPPY